MLMLLSLPASLAGLHVGMSEPLGGMRCFGVPSPSLPFRVRTGVLGQSLPDSSWPLWSFAEEGELRAWISAACLARPLVFESAFGGLG